MTTRQAEIDKSALLTRSSLHASLSGSRSDMQAHEAKGSIWIVWITATSTDSADEHNRLLQDPLASKVYHGLGLQTLSKQAWSAHVIAQSSLVKPLPEQPHLATETTNFVKQQVHFLHLTVAAMSLCTTLPHGAGCLSPGYSILSGWAALLFSLCLRCHVGTQSRDRSFKFYMNHSRTMN